MQGRYRFQLSAQLERGAYTESDNEVLTIVTSLLNAVCSTGVQEAGYSLPYIYYELLMSCVLDLENA